MDTYDTDLIQMFVAESLEMIDEVEPVLIELKSHTSSDNSPVSLDDINFIFRLFHSIKGSSGFLQYDTITGLTHDAETILDLTRKGAVTFSASLSQLLVRSCDQLRVLLNTVGESLSDKGHEAETKQLMDELKRVAQEQNNSKKNDTEPEAETKALNSSDQKGGDQNINEPLGEGAKADAIVNDELNECEDTVQKSNVSNAMISDDMLKIFIQDSEDVLDQAEHALLEIQGDPENVDELIKTAFRALHTFKGNAGFMNFDDLVVICHKVEAILQFIREGKMECEGKVLRVLLPMIDTFRHAVTDVANGGSGHVAGKVGFIDLLDDLLPAHLSKPVSSPMQNKISEQKEDGDKREPAVKISPAAAPAAGSEKTAAAAPKIQKSIRVNVDKLDHLNDLVGELVISEAMVTNNKDLRGLKLENFNRASHRLNLITSELQDLSMSLRMIPIENTLKKLIRLTHDVSEKTGKKVDLKLLGTNTEVDRTVAEMIADPLVHIVRNSIDHGIETPEERVRLGKPEKGSVIVEAKHQSGEVWIVVTDDGKGMDADKILQRAIERDMIKEHDAQRLNKEEALELIFEPGFSTAPEITDVSGRGVGMDVVKKNIEKLNGRIEINSLVGKGTDLTIRIPLTLAIINGMVVRVGCEHYIIPLLSIKESFKPTADMINTVTNKGETICLRGELLSLFRLSRIFGISGGVENPVDGIVVVVESTGRKIGLLIDELMGQQQTVIKSLGETLRGTRGISGASIMSDGRIALIIDIDDIVRLATTCVK